MGQKLRSKKVQDNFFCVTIMYLKENSKIKDNPEIRKAYFLGAWLIDGIDFYTGKYSITINIHASCLLIILMLHLCCDHKAYYVKQRCLG